MGWSRLFRILPTILVIVSFAVSQATLLAIAVQNQAVSTQLPGQDPILLGTAWYPEHWPESRWEEDLRLMKAANIKMVRLAEFAWSSMEPSEGRFEFDWLERAVSLAARYGMVSVLGTPTAAPPAWLTQKYPDTLRVEENGRRVAHGNRAHGSVTSPRYREFCRRIAEQMAIRFGKNPHVIGWQIDNEYGYGLMSYDGATRQQFQSWLKAKYKTLKSLNDHWSTAYWSETYTDWTQIPIPVGYHNPGLMLEWKRFVTASWADYQQNQIDAIRQHADPRQFITGNFMGFFDGFDHYVISRPLTFVSWDSYVGSGHLDVDRTGLSHDLVRGFKRQNFWLIETQPGAVNWAWINNFLNRGEMRVMAWQAIGHGADLVSYWQWRSALGGQEQYHGTLVGPDGTSAVTYEEVSQIGREFIRAGSSLKDTTPVSQVALLHSYDSRWAIDFQKHHGQYDQVRILTSYYRALRQLAQSIDVVNPYAPLQDYRLVVAPNLNLIPEDLAKHLLEYVQNGGHLVLGPRSGMKDEFNSVLPQRQPGFLVGALGGRVEQYYALEKNFPISGAWGSGEAVVWAEQMQASAQDTEVLMRYGRSNGWLDDQPAVLTRSYGKGRITYIGAILDEKLMATAAEWMLQKSGVVPVLGSVPDGVEVCRRVGEGKQVFILINHTQEKRRVTLPRSMKFLLAGKEADTLELAAYGVEVLLDHK